MDFFIHCVERLNINNPIFKNKTETDKFESMLLIVNEKDYLITFCEKQFIIITSKYTKNLNDANSFKNWFEEKIGRERKKKDG